MAGGEGGGERGGGAAHCAGGRGRPTRGGQAVGGRSSLCEELVEVAAGHTFLTAGSFRCSLSNCMNVILEMILSVALFGWFCSRLVFSDDGDRTYVFGVKCVL